MLVVAMATCHELMVDNGNNTRVDMDKIRLQGLDEEME